MTGPRISRRAALTTAALASGATLLPRTAAAATAQPLTLPARPQVLLVGDSYTEGYGAVPTSMGYAYKVAGPLGWDLTRDGIGGTGYVNPGPRQQGRYTDRLWRHPADAYDLVVLQGGSNDEAWDASTIKGHVNMTVRTVRSRFPHAQLLLLGPTSPYGSVSAARAKVNDVLAGYTSENAILYLDPIAERWFSPGDGTLFANPDNGHPNNAGHAVIAKLFVQAFKEIS